MKLFRFSSELEDARWLLFDDMVRLRGVGDFLITDSSVAADPNKVINLGGTKRAELFHVPFIYSQGTDSYTLATNRISVDDTNAKIGINMLPTSTQMATTLNLPGTISFDNSQTEAGLAFHYLSTSPITRDGRYRSIRLYDDETPVAGAVSGVGGNRWFSINSMDEDGGITLRTQNSNTNSTLKDVLILRNGAVGINTILPQDTVFAVKHGTTYNGTNPLKILDGADNVRWKLDDNFRFKIGDNSAANIGVLDNSVVFEIESTARGLLPPRMTEAQKNAIGTPATGLLIYQTDATDGYWYYNGIAWVQVGAGASTQPNANYTHNAASTYNALASDYCIFLTNVDAIVDIPNGTFDGQEYMIKCTVFPTTCAVTATAGMDGDTNIPFVAEDECIVLRWDNTASTYRIKSRI